MIVVTGGAGFIGSNIVRTLNVRGRTDVLVVDDLSDGRKFRNLVDCGIADYLDREEFMVRITGRPDSLPGFDAVFHEGACSSTTEWDGEFIMRNNYEYSKKLLHYCLDRAVPFLYASSAAVYGKGRIFSESRQNESPLNVYGYSKFLFDQYVRRLLPGAESQVAGFRYFNVYGPREGHKGDMASVALQFHQQIEAGDKVRLFKGCDGYGDGGQRRDFVYAGDAADVNLWFFEHPDRSGIFNLGTGCSQSFNDVARAVLGWHGRGDIEYIPFPAHLRGQYQSYTEADISALRAAGYTRPFRTVEEGIPLYMEWLRQTAIQP